MALAIERAQASEDARRAEVRVFVDWFNRVWKRPPNLIAAEEEKPQPDAARIEVDRPVDRVERVRHREVAKATVGDRRAAGELRLLQRARDEAHRFGLAYNRKRRAQRTITSELLNIPGIGPTKRRLLLERFGSLAGVRSASVAELASVPGFSTRLAERILEHLVIGR